MLINSKITKKNKSILKRILALFGAGICVLVCMLTFGYNSNMIAYARVFDEYYSYSSIEHNVNVSFSKNLFRDDTVSGFGHVSYSFNDLPAGTYTLSAIALCEGSQDTYCPVRVFSDGAWVGRFDLLNSGTRSFSTIKISQSFDELIFYCGENTSSDSDFVFEKVQFEFGSSATDYVPFQQNNFISFTNTLNVGIDKDSSAWLLEQCVFNNLRTSDNNYYMKSSIEDRSLQNVIYYTSNNIKGNFMFKDFFKYKDNVIDETNCFRLFVNFDYIESPDYDSTTYFNGNVQRIVYGSYKNWESYKSLQVREKPSDWGTQYSKFNFISYVDNNGNNCNIYFPLFSGNDNDYYEFRTLFVNTNGLTDYSDGYNAGYITGKNDGYVTGKKVGYDNGYTAGKTFGYNNGYNAGTQDSNQYTFLNLISSCIDAPITYFQSLFNFELLGVNLQGFLTGLFTLCVIVTIIKLCLGR